MDSQTNVMEYQCPCCGAGLAFSGQAQQLHCEYCGNTFDIDAVRAFNEKELGKEPVEEKWDHAPQAQWSEEEESSLNSFVCPSCGGEIVTDSQTAATFCPYCGNPAIMPSRLSGSLKPQGVIPFQTTKQNAQEAFLKLCKGKPLLPRFFTSQQQIEKITGIYVPFWLYSCSGSFHGQYKATRIHQWSDSQYHYTKTDHYLLERKACASFSGIPMDGSSKMDNTLMESIEPYDQTQMVDFDTAYLSGFLADKYDVPYEDGHTRVRQRVEASFQSKVQSTALGYATLLPTVQNLDIPEIQPKYVLLPVWLLNTRYRGKLYTFAMNGQTGRMTGTFPVCPRRTAMWFTGIFAAVTILASAILMLMG